MTITFPYWRDLAIETLRNPAAAAEPVMAFHLPRDVLWLALLLVAVLNTIVYMVTNILVPTQSPLPGAFQSPVVFLFIVAGGLVLTVHALYWTGRALGGTGELGDILVLMIWLQALRVALQVITLVMLLLAPVLAAFVVMAAALWGIWILVHFINTAHHLNSVPRAAGVLVAAMLGLALGLSFFLSLIGATFLGSVAYV